MTNLEMAASLRALADVYEKNAETELIKPYLYMSASSKGEIIAILKAVGGKFTKSTDEHDSYPNIRFESCKIKGLTIVIPRDKVCRKTVKWDCEPLLSPEDEAKLEEVGRG